VNPVSGSFGKKAEEDATFCLIKMAPSLLFCLTNAARFRKDQEVCVRSESGVDVSDPLLASNYSFSNSNPHRIHFQRAVESGIRIQKV
jgi:hypothetical protein